MVLSAAEHWRNRRQISASKAVDTATSGLTRCQAVQDSYLGHTSSQTGPVSELCISSPPCQMKSNRATLGAVRVITMFRATTTTRQQPPWHSSRQFLLSRDVRKTAVVSSQPGDSQSRGAAPYSAMCRCALLSSRSCLFDVATEHWVLACLLS